MEAKVRLQIIDLPRCAIISAPAITQLTTPAAVFESITSLSVADCLRLNAPRSIARQRRITIDRRVDAR